MVRVRRTGKRGKAKALGVHMFMSVGGDYSVTNETGKSGRSQEGSPGRAWSWEVKTTM